MTETPPPPHEPDPVEADTIGPNRGRAAVEPVDPYGSLDPVDEAASAALDGLTPDAAALPIDPARLDERIQELTGITALLAEPIPQPTASVIDAQITAALAALDTASLDDGGADTGSPGAGPAVTAPAVAALADRRRRPPVSRWLAVAAAVAVVALAIPVVQSLSESSTSSTDKASVAAGTADSSPAESGSGADGPTAAQSEALSTSTTTTSSRADGTVSPASGTDLGTAETPQALTALVQGAVPPDTLAPSTTLTTDSSAQVTPSTTAATPRSLPPCDAANRAANPDLGTLRYTATATYQSIPVEIDVYDVVDAADPATTSSRLIATAVEDCRVLLDRPLP